MKKIALVIGHRSLKQGAYGNAGVSEFAFYNRYIEELLPQLPKDKSYAIFRRKDDLSGYSERMQELHSRIDEWGADISISFHFNAFGNTIVNGHEILYCSKNGEKLAKSLDEKFDKYLNNSDRNIKKLTMEDRGGGFVCRGKSICILVEPFFAAHQSEFMLGGAQRQAMSKALIEFIKELQ